jgi:PAS domain-containing protein
MVMNPSTLTLAARRADPESEPVLATMRGTGLALCGRVPPPGAAPSAWRDSDDSMSAATEGLTVDSADYLFAALSTRDLPQLRDRAEARGADRHAALRAVAASLDRLNVAACTFDDSDRTVAWNEAFLRLFPEHAGFIHEGEPYRDHLRRFYRVRLDAGDLSLIERYVDEGLRRPDEQMPQAFSHRGAWLQASEQAWPGGRVCVWTQTASAAPARIEDELDAPGMVGLAGGLDLFEHVGEGIMLTDPHGRIRWVNEAFVAMYRLADKAAAVASEFADVYRDAWRGADPSERARFASGLMLLDENTRFVGAPFELPLPRGRWVRVVEQRRPDGYGCFAHVDISMLKRRESQLVRAERRARECTARLADRSALLATMLDRIEQGVLIVDAEGVVELCNGRALDLLGLPAALMEARPVFAEVRALDWIRITEVDDRAHSRAVANGSVAADAPRCFERRRRDGRVLEIQSVPLAGGGVLHTFSDATVRRLNEARLARIARHERLSPLSNHDAFLQAG